MERRSGVGTGTWGGRIVRGAAGVVAASLLLVGCGSDGPSSQSSPETTSVLGNDTPAVFVTKVWSQHMSMLALGADYNRELVEMLAGMVGFDQTGRDCVLATLEKALGPTKDIGQFAAYQLSATVLTKGKPDQSIMSCASPELAAAVKAGTVAPAADLPMAQVRELLSRTIVIAAKDVGLTDAEARCAVDKSLAGVTDDKLAGIAFGGRTITEQSKAFEGCLTADRLDALVPGAAKLMQKDSTQREANHQRRQAEIDQQMAQSQGSQAASTTTP